MTRPLRETYVSAHSDCDDQTVTLPRLSEEELARTYVRAKRAVVDHGFIDEIAWQSHVRLEDVTRQSFLREAAWVVLNTGMRESVIRRLFADIEEHFSQFEPEKVWRHRRSARAGALTTFGHSGKIDAIIGIAGTVCRIPESDLAELLLDPEPFLTSLPYIGPVTWRHLAKNLGAPTAKPDRHLLRFTKRVGRSSVDELCGEISNWLGEPVSVVDVVLWRWSVLGSGTCGAGCHPVNVF